MTADTDAGDTMNKKIRNAQLSQHNFILVVGEKEQSKGTVNIRTRENVVLGEFTIDYVVERFGYLAKEKILKSEESFKKVEVVKSEETCEKAGDAWKPIAWEIYWAFSGWVLFISAHSVSGLGKEKVYHRLIYNWIFFLTPTCLDVSFFNFKYSSWNIPR